MGFADRFLPMIQSNNDKGITILLKTTLSNNIGFWINEGYVDKYGDYVHKPVDILESKDLIIYSLRIKIKPL